MRIALGIEYAGHNYSGWQRQNDATTIQGTLESSLSEIADEAIAVICAGRTDAGVHAIQQVVHFDTDIERPSQAWVFGTNTKLPADIAVSWAKSVNADFHARFSALSRTYQYIILNRRSRPAILDKNVTWECRDLDVEKMKMAAESLLGEHDFTSFRAAACQAKSPVREIFKLEIDRVSEYIVLTVSANAFLQHMVRNITGVLLAVGLGKENVDWVADVLRAKDRTVAGVTAPADGLYLVNVHYPEEFAIPMPETLMQKLSLFKNSDKQNV